MLIIDLIYNLSVLVALSVLSGFIDNRYDRKTIKGVMFQGLLFGFVAIIGMLYPFILMPGIIFDGRSIVISLCTLFFGPIAGLLSSLMAIIFRNILGGGGALMGTLVISSSFIIGYYFYYKRTKNKFPLSKINLYLFGVLTSAAMMALMLSLPSAAILTAYKTITFTVMLAYPIISFVIGKILLDQEENRNSIEKIKQEESLFRTTLYSIGDAVITTDNSGFVQYMNPIAEYLTGWNESDAKGMKLTDVFKIINEDTRLEVENPVVRVLKEKTIVGLANHTLLISKDGGEKPIADSGAPIIDENGNIIGVVLVFRDQTNERKKEIELKEREEKLQSIFRAAPIGIGVVINRVFVEINPRMCEMVGYTKEELIGKNSRLLYSTQEEYDFVGSEKYKQIASHGTGAVETRFVRKDGRIIDILLASTPIEFDDLSKGVTFTALDISERKRIEAELQSSEEKFRSIVEGAPEPIFIQLNGKFAYVNPAFIELVGAKNSSELIGSSIMERFHPDYHKEILERIKQLNVEKRRVQTTEMKYLRMDGSEIWVETTGEPIVFDGGNGALVFVRNINDRKLASEALKESEEKYRYLFEKNPHPMLIYEIESLKIIDVNNTAVLKYGYSRQEFLSMTVLDLRPDYEKEKFLNKSQSERPDLETSGPWNHIQKNGTEIIVEVSSHLIEYQSKKARIIVVHDITEKLKAENALRQSEERWQFALEGPGDGVWDWNIKTNEVYFSHQWKAMLGYEDDEIKNMFEEWKRIIHPDDFKEAIAEIEKHFKNEVPFYQNEQRLMCKDGSYKWVLDRGKVIAWSDDGSPHRMIGTHTDISLRKKTEESLRQSEEKMRLIIEGTSFFFFYTQNSNADLTYISPTVEKITGYNAEEWMNQRHWFTTENPVNENAFKRTHQHLQGKIISEPLYLEIKHKNGSNILLEIFETPIIKNGKVEGLQGIARDITENKQAEKALKESEEKFRFIFENHSAVKLLIEADTGDIYDANFAAEKFYGFSREKLKQMNISQINTLSQEEVQREMQKAVEEKRVQFQFQHKLADGSIRNVEVFSSKVEIAGIKYLHSIIQDVTEKMKAEEQLKLYREHLEELVKLRTKELNEANNRLLVEIEKEKEYEMLLKQALEKEKEINEIKSRFISTTSHEFRTPLTAVLSSFELIQRYGKKWDEEKYNYHATKIKNSIEYLTNLLDDVLTISRSESGKIAFEPTNINLKNMCTELIEEAKIHCNEKHRFVYDFEPEQVEFCLDPKLIRFMLTNLLTNAVKYSPAGGEIYLNVKSVNDRILLKITDEGIGIPEDETQYLFEPFHRAKNTTEIQGTGLGLSIVKRSVQIHQGDIKVDSKLGKGTSFTIILPLNKGSR